MPWLTVPAEPSHLASPAVCVFPAEASDIMEQRPIIPAMLCLNPWPIESGSRVNCFVPCFRVICYAAIDDQYSCASWDVPCSHLRGPNQTIFSSWPLSSWLGSHSACKSLLQGKGTGVGVVVWWWWGGSVSPGGCICSASSAHSFLRNKFPDPDLPQALLCVIKSPDPHSTSS